MLRPAQLSWQSTRSASGRSWARVLQEASIAPPSTIAAPSAIAAQSRRSSVEFPSSAQRNGAGARRTGGWVGGWWRRNGACLGAAATRRPPPVCCFGNPVTGAVIAQLAARRSHNPKVVSSILTHRMPAPAPARPLALPPARSPPRREPCAVQGRGCSSQDMCERNTPPPPARPPPTMTKADTMG